MSTSRKNSRNNSGDLTDNNNDNIGNKSSRERMLEAELFSLNAELKETNSSRLQLEQDIHRLLEGKMAANKQIAALRHENARLQGKHCKICFPNSRSSA